MNKKRKEKKNNEKEKIEKIFGFGIDNTYNIQVIFSRKKKFKISFLYTYLKSERTRV